MSPQKRGTIPRDRRMCPQDRRIIPTGRKFIFTTRWVTRTMPLLIQTCNGGLENIAAFFKTSKHVKTRTRGSKQHRVAALCGLQRL